MADVAGARVIPAPVYVVSGNHEIFGIERHHSVLHVLGERLEIALDGHIHRREQIRLETVHGTRRFFQTAAVTGPATGPGPLGFRSGVTLYRITDGLVDDGTFVALDAARLW